jgi:hypothetical protein
MDEKYKKIIEEKRQKLDWNYCEECPNHTRVRCDSAGETDSNNACIVNLTSTSFLDVHKALENEKCPLGLIIKETIYHFYVTKNRYAFIKEGNPTNLSNFGHIINHTILN